jgi:basic amino acid/polyamine antiporter, APA family
MMVLPLHGDPHGATIFARGMQYASRTASAPRCCSRSFRSLAATDGRGHPDFNLRLRQRHDAGSGARAYYAMSAGRPLLQVCRQAASALQDARRRAAGAGHLDDVLCVSGSYGQLLDYIIFAVLVFYILTIVGLFVLRFKQPDTPRPYKAFGYPFCPAFTS